MEAFRALLNLELIQLNYFDSTSPVDELAKTATWLSKMLLPSLTEETQIANALRRVVCAFALAVQKDQPTARRDRLATIFEVLLLTKTKSCRPTLEWLAVVVASWCRGLDSNGDLSLGFLCNIDLKAAQSLPEDALQQVFDILLQDLPANLAAFSRREKLSAMVSNILHRLYQHWSELDVGDKDILDVVQRAIICCQASAANDSFTSLASSILLQCSSPSS